MAGRLRLLALQASGHRVGFVVGSDKRFRCCSILGCDYVTHAEVQSVPILHLLRAASVVWNALAYSGWNKLV